MTASRDPPASGSPTRRSRPGHANRQQQPDAAGGVPRAPVSPWATRLIEKEVVGPDDLTALVKSAEA